MGQGVGSPLPPGGDRGEFFFWKNVEISCILGGDHNIYCGCRLCVKRFNEWNCLRRIKLELKLEPQLTEANNISVCVCVSVCALNLDNYYHETI